MRRRRIGEFELIARYFAPLAKRLSRRRRAFERQRLPAVRSAPRPRRQDRHGRRGRAFPGRREARAGGGQGAARLPVRSRGGRRRALHLPALAVAAEVVERALDRGLCARPCRGSAPLRHRAERRRHRDDAGPAHRHRHRLRSCAARPRPDTRRCTGRRPALRHRHDRRRRARPACGARPDRLGGAREALSPAATALGFGFRDWSASRAQSPMSPTDSWPMPATSPRRRGLPFASSASGCRCPPPPGA